MPVPCIFTKAGLNGQVEIARKKAFGGIGTFGEDGGGFIEFKDIPSRTGSIMPFYLGWGRNQGNTEDSMLTFANYWFAENNNKQNVMHLVYGIRFLLDAGVEYREPGGLAAQPGNSSNNCFLYEDAPWLEQNDVGRAQAVAHETGHIFGVVSPKGKGDGKFAWVDTDSSDVQAQKAHDPTTLDIMYYGSELFDDKVEFSSDILFHFRTRGNPDR